MCVFESEKEWYCDTQKLKVGNETHEMTETQERDLVFLFYTLFLNKLMRKYNLFSSLDFIFMFMSIVHINSMAQFLSPKVGEWVCVTKNTMKDDERALWKYV